MNHPSDPRPTAATTDATRSEAPAHEHWKKLAENQRYRVTITQPGVRIGGAAAAVGLVLAEGVGLVPRGRLTAPIQDGMINDPERGVGWLIATGHGSYDVVPLHAFEIKAEPIAAEEVLRSVVKRLERFAPAELADEIVALGRLVDVQRHEPRILALPYLDRDQIIATLERIVQKDPSGKALLRWPIYDALRVVSSQAPHLFREVSAWLSRRDYAKIAQRIEAAEPDRTHVPWDELAAIADTPRALVWGKDRSGFWWLLTFENDEPKTMYRPNYGERPASRDMFVQWHVGPTAVGGTTFDPQPPFVALQSALGGGGEVRMVGGTDRYGSGDRRHLTADAEATGTDAIAGGRMKILPPQPGPGGEVVMGGPVNVQPVSDPFAPNEAHIAAGQLRVLAQRVDALEQQAARTTVSTSTAIHRALAELDAGIQTKWPNGLSPEAELQRFQVDVLLLLVDTLRRQGDDNYGTTIVEALDAVASQAEHAHREKWKGVPDGLQATSPPEITVCRSIAAALAQRFGISREAPRGR